MEECSFFPPLILALICFAPTFFCLVTAIVAISILSEIFISEICLKLASKY